MYIKKVIVECNPDEILACSLGLGKKNIVHQANKGEVCNYHSKNNVRIAIINEDPASSQPKYLKNFDLEEEKYGVKKLINKSNNKIILVIKPRLEEWIISQCLESKINPENFYLPNNAKRLKDVINLRLNHFESLVQELVKKENNGLKYLKSII